VEVLDIFKSTPRQHMLGLAGGAIWCTGMVTSLAAASAPAEARAGAVAAYLLAQGFALVAALWGISVVEGAQGGRLARQGAGRLHVPPLRVRAAADFPGVSARARGLIAPAAGCGHGAGIPVN